jgi:fumarate hydratase subunit beta
MNEKENVIKLSTPLDGERMQELRAGQVVELSGVVYAARDTAHQRMVAALNQRQKLPIDLEGAVIYYCGPAPAPPGRAIGACGPTTSARMDRYTEALLQHGLAATIGKGNRSIALRRALMVYGAVYMVAVGGTGALVATHVTNARTVAYAELGPEAVYELTVQDLPLLIGYDVHGGTIFAGETPLRSPGVEKSSD